MLKTIDELCAAAERYRALGYKPIPLTDGKSPVGIANWQNREFSAAEIYSFLEKAKNPGIGLQNGPCCEKPIIECEWDTPAQERAAREIFGDDAIDATAAFGRPGDPTHQHRVFQYVEALAAIGKAWLDVVAGVKPNGKPDLLKIRIGVGPRHGAQSAFPPSPRKENLEGRSIEVCSPLAPSAAAVERMLELAKPGAVVIGESDADDILYADDFKVAAAVEAMLHATKNMEDQNDGSNRKKVCIERCYDESLTPEAAITAFRLYEEQRPFSRKYDDANLLQELEKIAATKRPRKPRSTRTYECTDHGNAERFAAQHAENARYCYEAKAWLVWDGTRWKIDDSGEIIRLAKRTARSIHKEADACENADARKALKAWAKKSNMRSTLLAMIALAESQEPLPISTSNLNSDPWLLNFENGTVDLRTGKLRKHERDDYITSCCPIEFGGKGKPHKWLAFLEQCHRGNQKVIAYLKRSLGSTLLGQTAEQDLEIHDGQGANGKSTYWLTHGKWLGRDYMMTANANLLTLSKHDRHPTELMDLYGKRVVVSFETAQDAVLDEAKMKHLTGGDPIRARWCCKDFIEFLPTHSMRLATNHRPRIVVGGHATWRRIRVVPWEVVIPEAQRVLNFENTFDDELGLIAAWAVEGCQEWQLIGLDPPQEVLASTAEYRAESDLLARFFEECCELEKRYDVPVADLYNAWAFWLDANKERHESATAFSKRLKNHRGLSLGEKGKQNVRTVFGIKLKTQEDQE